MQQAFVRHIAEHGDAARAARDAGYAARTAASKGRTLRRELATEIERELRVRLVEYVPNALTNLRQLADSAESESVRYNANRDLLDRAGWQPVQKHEQVGEPTYAEVRTRLAHILGSEAAADALLAPGGRERLVGMLTGEQQQGQAQPQHEQAGTAQQGEQDQARSVPPPASHNDTGAPAWN